MLGGQEEELGEEGGQWVNSDQEKTRFMGREGWVAPGWPAISFMVLGKYCFSHLTRGTMALSCHYLWALGG